MHDSAYYKSIGFKCGLEIHQRLATKEKLFCSCSAEPIEDKKTAVVERRQRAVAGELGKVDRASAFESGKDRRFVYNIYDRTTCLVDIDEEPPHVLNKEALDISLAIAGLFNSGVPDEIEVMRKGVVDGSDPSAFQRTMQIGYNGYIEIDGRRIKIPSIFLEEESSGIESSNQDSITYDCSRLGIPLVEIDTDPEIATPQEAKEVALKIGIMLRITGKVQRGIGTIRQDVNVSITNGARVEIKGFQELDTMDKVIESEIERQQKLIEIKEELERRNAKVYEAKEITKLLKDTQVNIIKNEISKGGVVYGFMLEKFKGMLGKEVNKDRRLGSEVSDYAKMAGVGGIIHSDENLSKYGFSEEEINSIKKELKVSNEDAFVIIVGSEKNCKRAADLAIYRARLSIKEVPSETRAADSKQSITRFLRPIPGGARMYPETDVMPVQVNKKLLKGIVADIPKIEEMQKKLESDLGNKQIASQLLRSQLLQRYLHIISMTNADRLVIALTLLEKFTELRRAGINAEKISDDVLSYIFEKYANKEITRIGIGEIIASIPMSEKEVDNIIKEKGLSRIRGEMLKELISKFKSSGKSDIIGAIMSKYRASVDADELISLLKNSK